MNDDPKNFWVTKSQQCDNVVLFFDRWTLKYFMIISLIRSSNSLSITTLRMPDESWNPDDPDVRPDLKSSDLKSSRPKGHVIASTTVDVFHNSNHNLKQTQAFIEKFFKTLLGDVSLLFSTLLKNEASQT